MSVSENECRKFDQLYEQHQGMVYKISLKYSDYNDDLADDATQHTFIKLYDELRKGTDLGNIQSFLYTIAKNYTLNSIKKEQGAYVKEELIDTDERDEMLVQSAEVAYVESVEKLQSNYMLQMILDELKEKNEIWYFVVMEVFYKGRNQSDVAKELGMNDTAMYATVRRIRRWSNKHKERFEDSANNTSKEVSDGDRKSVV